MKYEVIGEVRYAGDLVTVVHLHRGCLGTVSEGAEIPHVVPLPKERVERRRLGVWVHGGVRERVHGYLPAFNDKQGAAICPSLGSQIAQNSARPGERMH